MRLDMTTMTIVCNGRGLWAPGGFDVKKKGERTDPKHPMNERMLESISSTAPQGEIWVTHYCRFVAIRYVIVLYERCRKYPLYKWRNADHELFMCRSKKRGHNRNILQQR